MKHHYYAYLLSIFVCALICTPSMMSALASKASLHNARKEYALNKARIHILHHIAFPRSRLPHAREKLEPVFKRHPELHVDYFKAAMSAYNYLADNLDEVPLITKCVLKYRKHILPHTRLERQRIACRLYELKVEDAALLHSLVKLYERKQYLQGADKAELKKDHIKPLEAKRAIVSTAIKLLADLVKKPAKPLPLPSPVDQHTESEKGS